MQRKYLWTCLFLLLSFIKAEAADPAWSDVYLGYRPSDEADRVIQSYWAKILGENDIPSRNTFHFTVFHGSAFPVKCKLSTRKTYVFCQKAENNVNSAGLNTALYNTYDHVLTEHGDELSLSMRDSKVLKSGDFDDKSFSDGDKYFLVLNFDSKNKNKIHAMNTSFREAIDQNDLDGNTFPVKKDIDDDEDETVYIVSKVAKRAAGEDDSNISGKTTKVAPICCYKTDAPNRCVNISEGGNIRMDKLSCFVIASNKFYTLKDQSEYHITLADYLLGRAPLENEEGNPTILQRSKLVLKKLETINSLSRTAARNSNPLIGGDIIAPALKASALRGIFSVRNDMFTDSGFRTKALLFLEKIHAEKAKEIKKLFQKWDREIPVPAGGEERDLPESFAEFRAILESMLPDSVENVSVWAAPYSDLFDTTGKLLGWLNKTEITIPFNGDSRHYNPQ